MITLTPLQAKIYETAKASAGPVEIRTLRQSLRWSKTYFNNRLMACIQKGYVRLDEPGSIIACEPPHDRIIREICLKNDIEPSEIVSSSKTMKLTRVRRTIAHQLQSSSYSFVDIANVVNRHPSTVLDYLSSERAIGRSQRRSTKLKAQRASA